MGTVIAAVLRHRADHPVALFGRRLNQVFDIFSNIRYPGMQDSRLPLLHDVHAHKKPRLQPQLRKLAPGPEGVVFAISPSQRLEVARVLPDVWVVEEVFVRQIRAPDEPVHHILHGRDGDGTLACQVPVERPG